jgi:hypothetical protein
MRLTGWLVPALTWVLTRTLMLAFAPQFGTMLSGDVEYYWTKMAALAGGVPASATMVEYPTPVLWLLQVPFRLSGGGKESFVIIFVVILMLLDLVFALLLWQGGKGRVAVWFWICFGLAMGPLMYFRLDLVPAVLCAIALLALRRQSQLGAGGALALGAGLKLWPATLWPTMLRGDRKQDAKLTAYFFGGGVLLVVVAVLYAGIGRLLSPLQWQSARGLQVESLWATPTMVARLFLPGYSTEQSKWQAYEIYGPGVDSWLLIATVVTDLVYLAIVVAFILWIARLYPKLLRPRPSFQPGSNPARLSEVGLFMVMVITGILIANKTFSPQYVMWLAAPVAAWLLVVEDEPPTTLRRTARLTAVVVLVLAAATQVIYPLTYGSLLGYSEGVGPATAVLMVRNVLLVAFGGWLISKFVPVLRGRTPELIATAKGVDASEKSTADPSSDPR